MSEHEDRAPLILKIAVRQALRRLQEEANSFSQFEALAGNLGWEEVAEKAAAARMALLEAADRAADAVEATVKVQSETAHAHEHTHTHSHHHEHPHGHEHD